MLTQTANFLDKTGLTWFAPIVRLIAGEDPQRQMKEILLQIGVPVVAFAIFLVVWGALASGVQSQRPDCRTLCRA